MWYKVSAVLDVTVGDILEGKQKIRSGIENEVIEASSEPAALRKACAMIIEPFGTVVFNLVSADVQVTEPPPEVAEAVPLFNLDDFESPPHYAGY